MPATAISAHSDSQAISGVRSASLGWNNATAANRLNPKADSACTIPSRNCVERCWRVRSRGTCGPGFDTRAISASTSMAAAIGNAVSGQANADCISRLAAPAVSTTRKSASCVADATAFALMRCRWPSRSSEIGRGGSASARCLPRGAETSEKRRAADRVAPSMARPGGNR